MTVFPATKGRISLLPPLLLCRCVVLHLSSPHAENVTSHTWHHSSRRKKKAKIYVFTEENDKNNSNTVTWISNFNLITGLEIFTR